MSDRLRGLTPPLDGRSFRWSVGTRSIPFSEWLCLADATNDVMTQKDQLFASSSGDVVVQLAGSEVACDELLGLVRDFVAAGNPSHHSDQRHSGADDSAVSAIEQCGRLVAEDFCILQKDPAGDWRMTAACVCFPSRWNLRSKLGQNLGEIHHPVPQYEDRLGIAVDRLFDRMTTDQLLCRSNWTLLDTDERHLPIPDDSASGTGEANWLRIERQTLRRLPQSDAIVFTILTRIIHLDDLDESDRQLLARAASASPADVKIYKGWNVRTHGS